MQGCICEPGTDRGSSFLFLADCLEVIGDLKDASIDCLLTDPPFGYFYRSKSHKLPLTTIANDRHEAIPLLRSMLQLVHSKLKLDGVGFIFSNWQCYSPMKEVIEELFDIKNVLIWEKNAWSRGDTKGNWGYMYEMVIYFRKKIEPKFRRFLRGKRDGNILKYKKLPTNYMLHPTQKPIDMLEYLIEKSTAPGEMVLDPFCGSASTLVAAKNLGRNYIGIELEEVWYRVAKERLDAA